MSGAALTPPVGERDHAAGSADAPVTLVEYGDYECPYCGMAHPIVQRLQAALDKQLRFVFRNFPLNEAHPHARIAAQAAEGARAQGKFWEMHHTLFEHQDTLDRDEILGYAKSIGIDATRLASELDSGTYEKHVREDFRGGVKSGVNGTPSFFINGERYDGSWANEEAFLTTLREAAQAGTTN